MVELDYPFVFCFRTARYIESAMIKSIEAYMIKMHIMAMVSPFFTLSGANSICIVCLPAGTLMARNI